jgi:hypothetical protein
MAENNLQFDQLTDAAQSIAVTQFGRFYVRYFRTEGLDVFAQLDRSGYIADINQYLMENSALHSDELLTGLIQNRSQNLAHLISALGITFAEDGTAQPTLEQWYLNAKTQLN